MSINPYLCIASPVNHHLRTIRLDSMSSVNHSWYNVVLKVEQSLRMALFLSNLFWQNVCVHQQTEMSELEDDVGEREKPEKTAAKKEETRIKNEQVNTRKSRRLKV